MNRTSDYLRLALDSARFGVWEVTLPDRQLVWDAACGEIFGRTPDAYPRTGMEFMKLVVPEDREIVVQSMQRTIHEGRDYTAEFRIVRQDGSIRWHSAFGRRVVSDDGNQMRILGVCTDSTDRKLLEQASIHNQQMELVTRLAGGVAHDFNNLLLVISGHLDLLKYKLTPGEHEDEFQKIHQAVERATVLTRRLQHYSSGEVSRPELLNPRQALVEASSFLQRMISGAFTIRVIENTEASLIRIDRMRLLQVLVNLCSTACESIASGGVLQFEVRSGVTIPRQPLTRPSTPREKHVCLSVLAIPHVPQPGFIRAKKTSECDSRSGVGLAIVRGILSEIGGTLRLEPPCEKGLSRILCYFPLMPATVNVQNHSLMTT